MGRRELFASTAAVAVVGLIGGSLYFIMAAPEDRFADCRQGVVAGGTGVLGGPFTLVSETGATVTSAEVFDKPSLVYFGYSYCPDVCPLDNTRNAEAADILAENGIEIIPDFISVDPERDTPEVLADFTDYLHKDMIGLTGTAEQVRAAAQAYRVVYQKQESGDEFYLVNHTTFTYLVLPNEGVVEFFRREATAEEMAGAVGCFVEKAV